MKVYCDTSAILKRYAKEPGSDYVNTLFKDNQVVLFTSRDFTELELTGALSRMFTQDQAEQALCLFRQDQQKRLVTIATADMIWETAKELVPFCADKKGTVISIVHIASAVLLGEDTLFLTFDSLQAEAAKACGLNLLDSGDWQ